MSQTYRTTQGDRIVISDHLSEYDPNIDLSGRDVTFVLRHAGGDKLVDDFATIQGSNGAVSYTLDPTDTVLVGRHEFEWVVTGGPEDPTTFPIDAAGTLHIREDVEGDDVTADPLADDATVDTLTARELNGGATGNQPLTNIAGANLSISGGVLDATDTDTQLSDSEVVNATERVGSLSLSSFDSGQASFKNAPIYDVTAWGATGDGSTDDALAIQDAIDAASANGGGLVFVPGGTYRIGTTLTLKHNVRLSGAGRWATTLLLDGAVDANLVHVPTNENQTTISNLTLDGNKANNTVGACYRVSGYNWRAKMNDVAIRNAPGDGIVYENGGTDVPYEPMLRDVDVGLCANHGVVVNCYDLDILNIYSHENGGHGLDVTKGVDSAFHLHCYDNTHGLRIRGGGEGRYYNYFGDTNRQHGALIETSIGAQFFGGRFWQNSDGSAGTYNGVHLDGAQQVHLLGCIYMDPRGTPTQGYGVQEVNGGANNRIHYGKVSGNATGQFDVGNSTKVRDVGGYVSVSSGYADLTTDGSTRRFDVTSHGLETNPSSAGDIIATAEPVSSVARQHAPVDCVPKDIDGDGNYEGLEISFTSAPPNDFVAVQWQARLR